MKHVLVVMVLVAAPTALAHAGPYASLGLGRVSVHDDGDAMVSTDSPSTNVALGFGISRVAVEGSYTSYELAEDGDAATFASRTVGLALKGTLPLGRHLQVLGHGGVVRTMVDDSPSRMAMSGNGYSYGGGLEYRVDLVLIGVSAYADYTRNQVTLSNDDGDVDQTASMFSVGATLSF